VYPLSSDYLREGNLLAELSRIAAIQPELAQVRIIGFSSSENIPIYALEIGNNKAAKQALLIGQHHGDEVLGVNIAMALAENLLLNFNIDPAYKQLLQNYQIWIVPSINPEGWRMVSSGKFQHKRKNNRDTDKNKKLDLRTDGVDLNRNYPVFWDLDADANTISPYYKGAEPASESEVKAIINLAQQHKFSLAIFLHSSASGAYSEKVYLPARGNDSKLYQETLALAEKYAKSVKRDYHSGTYEVHTGVSSEVGNARNFFFHSMGCKAFLVEIGGINSRGRSVIHPNNKMLNRIVQKQVRSLTQVFLDLAADNPETKP
jgi:predicted deacylase